MTDEEILKILMSMPPKEVLQAFIDRFGRDTVKEYLIEAKKRWDRGQPANQDRS